MQEYIDRLTTLKNNLLLSLEEDSLNYGKLRTLYLVISVLDTLLFIEESNSDSYQQLLIDKLEEIKTALENL